MAVSLDSRDDACVNGRTTGDATQPRNHEAESNKLNTDISISSKGPNDPVKIDYCLVASAENPQKNIAEHKSTYLYPTWNNCNGNSWMTPHVHEQQKHTWHCSALGMGKKHVHDEWGFSSASVSRANSPMPGGEGGGKA